MPDDLTRKVFEGVERMIAVAIKTALLVNVREMIDTAVKSIPHGPAGPAGPMGLQGEKGLTGERGADGGAGPAGRDGAVGPQGERGLQGEKGLTGERGADGRDGKDGAAGGQGEPGERGPQGERGPEGLPGRDGRDALPMPGPQGEKGIDGRDGKDGKDGITLEHLKAAVAEMRAELRAEIIKSIQFKGRQFSVDGEVIATIPVPVYRSVFVADTQYSAGDMVTFGGSVWHCNNPTTERPGQNGDWTLAVKAGRDGRDRAK